MNPEPLYQEGRDEQSKNQRTGRTLAVLKALVLLILVVGTAYGMIRDGLYSDDLWLPVAAGVLSLLFVTLFVRGYYRGVTRGGWVLVALLAVLVAVKGFSISWTISDTLTIRELLRSAMYLATFVLALGSLSSERQVSPLVDVAFLSPPRSPDMELCRR